MPMTLKWLNAKKGRIALPLAVFLLFVCCGAALFGFMQRHEIEPWMDDAYITFVYARNLAEGRGLVFNEGERVWGFTSPAQTLLLAGFTRAGVETSLAGQFVGVLFITLSAFLIYRLAGAWFHPLVGLLLGLHHLAGAIGSQFLIGLETHGLIFSQLAFLEALRCRRYRSACALAALACLYRPDALVLVLPAMLLSKGCRQWRSLVWFALPGVAWLLFAWFYFGDILPNTFYAKTHFCSFSEYFGFTFFQVFEYRRLLELVPLRWVVITAGFCLGAACLLRLKTREEWPFLYALLVYPWILVLAYSLIGAPKYHIWETFSARFFHWFAILCGLTALLFLVGRHLSVLRPGMRKAVPRAAGVLAAVYILLVIPHDVRLTLSALQADRNIHYLGRRHEALVNLAGWLNQNIPAGESLASSEVGILKYHSHLRLVDRMGLTTRAVRDGRKLDQKEILLLHQPDYFLFHQHKPHLVVTPDLQYRAVQQFEGWGYKPITIFKKCTDCPPLLDVPGAHHIN
jgi:hypothetical protein